MNDFVALSNIEAVFSAKRAIPSITLWNRLEGRPRRHDFDRALQAEVRDALWMLTKQWQMGEFKGDDAGSPVTAKVHFQTSELTKYRPVGHAAEAFDDDVPLEAKVEQRPIPFSASEQAMSIDIRAEMGRRWIKLVDGLEGDLREKFANSEVGFSPPDPATAEGAPVCAHLDGWQAVSALVGRGVDGYALLQRLRRGDHAHQLITLLNAGSEGPMRIAETEFINWYERLFYQPTEGVGDAWQPPKLEYAFETSAPAPDGGETHLMADEYYHGHLDWYNLDIEPGGAGLGAVADAPLPADVLGTTTSSFLPTPISFEGMPHTRWWRFEDGSTNFGDVDPDTTEINKLLVMEFALVYANDWFMLPLTMPAGTLSRVRGLTVTNVFGERLWIEAAGKGDDEDWQRWSMYNLATRGSDSIPADTSLLVIPSAPKIHEGSAIEAAELIRDEVANMVWGIETRVPLPHGHSRFGRRTGRETRRYFKRLVEEGGPLPDPPDPLENEAAWRYRVMNSVPENWIPFVPVNVHGSTREIQLRRGAMPRLIEGDPNPAVPIRPRTDLLRHNLGSGDPYDLFEEEVPRAGIKVSQSFQRTRWYNGEVFVWVGVRKQTGRGEKSSRLRFDQLRRKRK